MEKKLKWNAIGLQKKTEILIDLLKKERAEIPSSHTKELKKFDGFIRDLEYLLSKIESIQTYLIPELESRFRLVFSTPELIFLALSRPSTRTIYENLEKFLNKKNISPFNEHEFSEIAASGDAGNVLALIGDAVLDLGVVQSLWDSSISTVGDLTKERERIVSNEHLAKVCDEWKLFEHRLTRENDLANIHSKIETLDHEKATLVEAIYGVIYLEFGFEELIRTVPLIQ